MSLFVDAPKNTTPIIIAIEGNIGAGKSTLLSYLEKEIAETQKKNEINLRIGFIKEPVDIWQSISDCHGENILMKFYQNPEKYSFAFQIMAYSTRLSILKKAIQSNEYDVIICERSLEADYNVFAKMLHADQKIEDIMFKVYELLYESTSQEFKTNGIIYLNAVPRVCFQRIMQRDRQGEDGISIRYLSNCGKYYSDWLLREKENARYDKVLEINCNTDVTYNNDVGNEWISQIINFINQQYVIRQEWNNNRVILSEPAKKLVQKLESQIHWKDPQLTEEERVTWNRRFFGAKPQDIAQIMRDIMKPEEIARITQDVLNNTKPAEQNAEESNDVNLLEKYKLEVGKETNCKEEGSCNFSRIIEEELVKRLTGVHVPKSDDKPNNTFYLQEDYLQEDL